MTTHGSLYRRSVRTLEIELLSPRKLDYSAKSRFVGMIGAGSTVSSLSDRVAPLVVGRVEFDLLDQFSLTTKRLDLRPQRKVVSQPRSIFCQQEATGARHLKRTRFDLVFAT